MKRGIIIYISIVLSIFVLLLQCNNNPLDDSNSNSSTQVIYGGSDPKGDLIAISIDGSASTVVHINYTTDETNGPYTYTKLSTDNGGFSILYKADLGSDGYAYFAEFPNSACVYQLFNSDGSANGEPQYAIYREQIVATNLYEKAYNWMQFKIDTSSTNDDMEAGFAAFDSASENGIMIGAGYSARAEFSGDANGGISDINSGDSVKLTGFSLNSETQALQSSTDLLNSFSLIGTTSGTIIIDFGINLGGGSGLAIPQATTSTFQSDYAGTYLLLIYEYNSQTKNKDVSIDKCVIDSSGNVKVFHFNDNTGTATPYFSASMTSIDAYSDGPLSQAIKTSFQSISGCATATSSTVQNAYQCKGGFIAETTETTVNINFDPNGKFLGFTGFSKWDDNGTSYFNIIFGFGIKDANYSDTNL